MSSVASKKPRTFKLRALGLCGVDDSVNPKLLGIISRAYPFVEFGVLFRPDKVCTINPAFLKESFEHEEADFSFRIHSF